MNRNRKPRVPRAKLYSYRCVDGPWTNQVLRLSSPVTLPVVIRGERGRYVSAGASTLRWEIAA